MTAPSFFQTAVPKRKGLGRPKSPNPYIAQVAGLIDATDEDGNPVALGVLIPGDADRAKNPAVRAACRRLDEAGKELSVTVRKDISVSTDDESMTQLVFWPVPKVERPETTKSAAPAETATETETAPEDAGTMAEPATSPVVADSAQEDVSALLDDETPVAASQDGYTF